VGGVSLIVYTLLFLLALLLAAVLFLPVDLHARTDPDLSTEDFATWRDPALPWRAQVTWGWGLVRVLVTGEGRRVTATRFTLLGVGLQGRKSRGRRAPAGSRKPRSGLPDLQTIRDFGREGWRLLARLWRTLHLQAEGAVTYGFSDPALTGWLLGARAIFWRGESLRLMPDFMGPRFAGWLQITGRFFGEQVLAALLAALWSPPIRRRWMGAIKLKVRRTFVRTGGRTA